MAVALCPAWHTVLRPRPLPARTLRRAHVQPIVRLPNSSSPFENFETFGWRWSPDLSLDENLLRLALLARLNCFKVANYTAGRCSAMMCRPPRINVSHVEIEVIGFGINTPPRFGTIPRDPNAGMRPWNRKEPPQNEIHSEMQIIGRCAREGIPMKGSWLYVALPPCWECCKALVAAGVARVLFKGKGRRAPAAIMENAKEKVFAEAFGMEWLHAEFSLEREQYLDEMWEAYKKELRITSPKEKGLIRSKVTDCVPCELGRFLVSAPKMTKDDCLKLAPVGAAFAAGQVATVASLGAVAVSFTHVVKALEPAVNAIASALILGQVFHPMVYASLLPVFAGVALASSKELSFTMFGFLTAMASNFFFVTRNVLATKFGDVGDMGEDKTQRKTNQLAVLTAVAALVFALVWCV
ncbi:unnamed protein product [Durusdinium trenchii]|uniref:Uncharacterized protein n=1 Tax=Durusdinium trenchii TaxID=1381693 RepID=A0ABP0MYT1_9DINO